VSDAVLASRRWRSPIEFGTTLWPARITQAFKDAGSPYGKVTSSRKVVAAVRTGTVAAFEDIP
jgi:hypothetical protein